MVFKMKNRNKYILIGAIIGVVIIVMSTLGAVLFTYVNTQGQGTIFTKIVSFPLILWGYILLPLFNDCSGDAGLGCALILFFSAPIFGALVGILIGWLCWKIKNRGSKNE
jgi:hypothetical protein